MIKNEFLRSSNLSIGIPYELTELEEFVFFLQYNNFDSFSEVFTGHSFYNYMNIREKFKKLDDEKQITLLNLARLLEWDNAHNYIQDISYVSVPLFSNNTFVYLDDREEKGECYVFRVDCNNPLNADSEYSVFILKED